MSYESLLDYLGDVRAPERLECPPGGSAGCNVGDAYLSVIAEKARRQQDPLAYLRAVAIRLQSQCGNWQDEALKRAVAWCAEFTRTDRSAA